MKLLTCLALVAGCKGARAEKNHAEPPYTARGDTLDVRADLFSMLAFEQVSSSSHGAVVTGLGRVAFAPGGAQAVRLPTSGFVEKILVSVGDPVREGQPLAVIRSSEVAKLRADVSRLSAILRGDTLAAQRMAELVKAGAASERELLELRVKISSAEAERQGTLGSLAALGASHGTGDRVELLASYAGHVLRRAVVPGERVSAETSEAAFLIGDPSRVVARASLPERDLPLLSRGANCRFSVSALGARSFAGKVVEVARAIDAKTQTVDITCMPASTDPTLTVDMAARVEVEVGSTQTPSVPRRAVLLRKDDRILFVRAEGNKLERRIVKLGASLGDRVQIVSGVASGEWIVVRNAVLLDGELDEVL